MASSPAKKFSLLLLFTLLSYPQCQARDSQLFSKVSAAAATSVPNQEPVPLNDNQQQEDQPSFFEPENENGYGLHRHEAGKRPTSSAKDHLPRNYNPVAYVTEPEEYTRDDSSPYAHENSYSNNLRNNYNDAGKSYDNEEEDEETSEPEQYRYNNDDQYYGGSSFNSGPQGLKDTRLSGEESAFRPQGMSDTRSLENGKYFYDIQNDRYSNNHPYEVLKRAGADNVYSERSYYGGSEDSMREPYQHQYEFQNEGSMP